MEDAFLAMPMRDVLYQCVLAAMLDHPITHQLKRETTMDTSLVWQVSVTSQNGGCPDKAIRASHAAAARVDIQSLMRGTNTT